jgi:addiction module HigA family antidote
MSNMHIPAHPGEVLREYLPEGVSIGEVAKRLGVTRQALSALLNGRAGVSAPMALRLEGALGTSAEMWLNMQTNHDLWRARKRPPRVQRMSASKGAPYLKASDGAPDSKPPGRSRARDVPSTSSR